jgi:hypothetical protein
MTTQPFSPLSRRTRIQRADAVRAEFRRGQTGIDQALGELRLIYPSLTLTDAGWLRLLTED